MAKKKEIIENPNPILESSIEDIFASRMAIYAQEIIPNRSLPDARDGLKPVQRRILYAMYRAHNTYDKPHHKSAKTVGLVIGNYHPHGDSSVYEAMVHLSQNWKMRECLVDMHGNNGSIDNDPAAAMRYTEARLSYISNLLLQDIDEDTVPFALNFDDTEEEPTVLPCAYPNLLVNGSYGMAIGYATRMPPHNLKEATEAAIYRLNHPNCSLEDLMKIIPGPDFPTGGIIQGKEGIKDMYTSGSGKFIVRAKAEIVETKTVNQIVITEIPYDVVKSDLVEKITDVKLSKDTQGILDVRDESDRTGLRIVIDIRKENDANMILNYLYKKTPLQMSYAANMTAIVNQSPKLMSLCDLLDAFVAHRKSVTLNRCKFRYNKYADRCHILEGLIKAVSILDDVIYTIRHSKDKADSKKNLCEKFDFTDKQAEAIVTLQLYRLSSTDIVDLKKEFAELTQTMQVLKAVIEHEEVLVQLVSKELKAVIEECKDPRRTEIQDEVEEIVIEKEKMLVNERVMLTISQHGYVKRVSLRSFNSSDNAFTGIKDDDQLVGYSEVDLLDQLLVVTDAGNYLALPIYNIDEFKWKDLGTHLSTYSNLNGSEKIISAYVVKTYDTDCYVVTATRNGMIKRTPFKALQPQRTGRLSNLMGVKKGDSLVECKLVYKDYEILVISMDGYSARYKLDQIPQTSLKAQGVKAMNLAKDDKVSDIAIIKPQSLTVALVTEEGASKRVKLSDIDIMNRPVKGLALTKKVKSHPQYVKFAECVQTYDEFNMAGENIQTIVAKDINLMSTDSTYSNSVNISKKDYLIKGIEEVKIVDFDPNEIIEEIQSEEGLTLDAENSNGEYEVFSLDV